MKTHRIWIFGLAVALTALAWGISALPSGYWKGSMSPDAAEDLDGHIGFCGQHGLVCATWIYGDGSGELSDCCIPADAVGSADITACNEDLRHDH